MSTGYAPALIDVGVVCLFVYSFLNGIWITIQWRICRSITNFFSNVLSIICLFS